MLLFKIKLSPPAVANGSHRFSDNGRCPWATSTMILVVNKQQTKMTADNKHDAPWPQWTTDTTDHGHDKPWTTTEDDNDDP